VTKFGAHAKTGTLSSRLRCKFAMGALSARIPPELAEQFERLSEPVVIHRLTRFDDPALCRAARDWLTEREAVRQAARHWQEMAIGRRERRRTATLAGTLVLAWAAILAAFFVLIA
jgi:hypothetical protein